jgi:glycosyltransferase involved in cell wall biosynthesis
MKGIDIVVEAFARMPETELYMIRDLKEEPKVRDWVLPIIEKHPHIHHFDNMDLASPAFDAIADPCIGLLQADSSSGGGPGTAVRAIHNGLIPIVTPSALVRSEILGYNIVGNSAEALIQSTIDNVRTVMNLPDHELQERSDSVREFAKKYHTREAFSQSFAKFLDKIGIRGK